MVKKEIDWTFIDLAHLENESIERFLLAVERAERLKSEKSIHLAEKEAELLRAENISPEIEKAIQSKITELKKLIHNDESSLVGSFIKHERENKGLTLADLSEKTGISPSYINRLEKGERKTPSIKVMEKLSRVLEIPIATFMNISGENYHPAIPLSQLIYANTISLKNGGKALTPHQKTVMFEIVEFLGEMKWKEDKHKEMLVLIELLDRFFEE